MVPEQKESRPAPLYYQPLSKGTCSHARKHKDTRKSDDRRAYTQPVARCPSGSRQEANRGLTMHQHLGVDRRSPTERAEKQACRAIRFRTSPNQSWHRACRRVCRRQGHGPGCNQLPLCPELRVREEFQRRCQGTNYLNAMPPGQKPEFSQFALVGKAERLALASLAFV